MQAMASNLLRCTRELFNVLELIGKDLSPLEALGKLLLKADMFRCSLAARCTPASSASTVKACASIVCSLDYTS